MTDKEKLSAQGIVQSLCNLRDLYIGREKWGLFPQEISENEALLRQAINEWGGLAQIEEWLTVNDPLHSRPSQIKGLDLKKLLDSSE